MLKGRGVLAGLFLSQLGGLGLSMGGQLLWKGAVGPLLSVAGLAAGCWLFFRILSSRSGPEAERADLLRLGWLAAALWLVFGGGGYALYLLSAARPGMPDPLFGGTACGLLLAMSALAGTVLTGATVLLDGSDQRNRYSAWPGR